MKLLRDRFPDRSTWRLVFAMCALPVNLWSWVLMFDKVPSLRLNWSAIQVTEILAYTQSFALFESVLFFCLLLLMAFLLPSWLLKERFISQATLVAFFLSIWAVGVHLMIRASLRGEIQEWNGPLFFAWCLGCSIIFLGTSKSIRIWPSLEKWLIARIDQATLLAYLFIVINILALIFVILRNIYLAFV